MEIKNLFDLSLKVRGFKCFGGNFQGFDQFKPFNIIVGRNNSGKSSLIDLLEVSVTKSNFRNEYQHNDKQFEIEASQVLELNNINRTFTRHSNSGGLPGHDDWEFGKQFIGQILTRKFNEKWEVGEIIPPEGFKNISSQHIDLFKTNLSNNTPFNWNNLTLKRILAERDITPETSNPGLTLSPNGDGATNFIQLFINSDQLPREMVEKKLLNALNKIYMSDNEFVSINTQISENGKWEIFLEEKNKGLIRLSQSGSGLKTVLLILINILLIPIKENIELKKTIFAFEELENNLHPALLRRLFHFLGEQQQKIGCMFVFTTHSNITIDWFSRRKDAQIIHVTHNGIKANCKIADGYIGGRSILNDLEVRPSDILQANGIVWVEGPTECIYLKKWIDLWSNNTLEEGTHYQCLFYGGRLLKHLNALPPDEKGKGVSMLANNRNAAILIDSDRKKGNSPKKNPPMRINDTKKRLKKEIEFSGGLAWITAGKEIENYIHPRIFKKFLERTTNPNVDPFESVFEIRGLGKYKNDKVGLAESLVKLTSKQDLFNILDLDKKLDKLCKQIRSWNGM